MPSGWIAIAYVAGGETCPQSTDPENPYTAAVIERYTDRPVGSTMQVCADQPVPRGWARERAQARSTGCAGARVREGAPTTYVMRRIR